MLSHPFGKGKSTDVYLEASSEAPTERVARIEVSRRLTALVGTAKRINATHGK